MTVDSKGMTRILLCSLGWQWTPVLDLNLAKRTPDHTLWPVTVKGNRLSHVLLNGESRPATYPQPVTSMKVFKMPITESREGKDRGVAQNERMHSLLWENSLTSHFEALKGVESSTGYLPEGMTSEDLEKKLEIHQKECDTTINNLFQLACQQQRLELATDYAHRLRTEQGLMIAMKIANHFGRTSVAAAIDDMLAARQEAADELAWQQQQAQGQYQGEGEGEGGMQGGDDHMDSQGDRENSVPQETNRYNNSNSNNTNNSTSNTSGNTTNSLSRKSKTSSNFKEDTQDTQLSFQPDSMPAPRSQPVNPFARQGSPPKRKSLMESLKDLKGSPSPKKATLSVSGSVEGRGGGGMCVFVRV